MRAIPKKSKSEQKTMEGQTDKQLHVSLYLEQTKQEASKVDFKAEVLNEAKETICSNKGI